MQISVFFFFFCCPLITRPKRKNVGRKLRLVVNGTFCRCLLLLFLFLFFCLLVYEQGTMKSSLVSLRFDFLLIFDRVPASKG